MVEYTLLDNYTAVITNRATVIPHDKLVIKFIGAKDSCQALLDIGGHQYFRAIKDELCLVEATLLEGVIKVSIVDYDGHSRPTVWEGEELKANRKHGQIEIRPNDADLYKLISRLRCENNDLRAENKKLWDELKRLDLKLTNIMEGYDLV